MVTSVAPRVRIAIDVTTGTAGHQVAASIKAKPIAIIRRPPGDVDETAFAWNWGGRIAGNTTASIARVNEFIVIARRACVHFCRALQWRSLPIGPLPKRTVTNADPRVSSCGTAGINRRAVHYPDVVADECAGGDTRRDKWVVCARIRAGRAVSSYSSHRALGSQSWPRAYFSLLYVGFVWRGLLGGRSFGFQFTVRALFGGALTCICFAVACYFLE
jgi:hypothetical protein